MDAFEQAERLVTSGDYGSAKSEYERIIGSESDNSAAWYGLGVVNHAVGDVEAAIVAFERAFLINRFHAPTAANLAFLFSQRDSDQASKYAKAAIEQGLSNDELQALASQVIEDKEVPEEEAPVILAEAVPVETESQSYNLAEKVTTSSALIIYVGDVI